jgi:hypothetical protein
MDEPTLPTNTFAFLRLLPMRDREWQRRANCRSVAPDTAGRNSPISPIREKRSRAVRSTAASPGLGNVLAARIAGEIGDHIKQFDTPNALQGYAGTAPVTRRSGRSEFVVARRLAHFRYLGTAVHQWAFCSLTTSGWARQFYDSKITAGKSHHAAPLARPGQPLAANPLALPDQRRTKPFTSATDNEPPNTRLRHEVDRGCLIGRQRSGSRRP